MMIETLCLSPAALAMFLSALDPQIVETDPTTNTVVVHAEVGKVEWKWVEELNAFAVDGKLSNCKPSNPT